MSLYFDKLYTLSNLFNWTYLTIIWLVKNPLRKEMASAGLLSTSVSSYFMKGNYEKFLELKRAVKRACSSEYESGATLTGINDKLDDYDDDDGKYDIGSHYTTELPEEVDTDSDTQPGSGREPAGKWRFFY